MPAHTPPHRTAPVASSFHRFAMVALATAQRDGWRASDLELLIDGPSYTSTTLHRLHRDGYAEEELFFVAGADAFAEVESWKDYPSILDAAHFAVVSRTGHPASGLPARVPALAARMTTRTTPPGPGTCIFLIDAVTADVSATAIRRRLFRREPIHGLVPPEVEQHIRRHGLYAAGTASTGENEPFGARAAGRLHGEDR